MIQSLLVIGAGIGGLAVALAAAKRGWKVTVVEQNDRALGASIQNFGLVFPLATTGAEYEIAQKSLSVWDETLTGAGIAFHRGSVIPVCSDEGMAVLQAFYDGHKSEREVSLMGGDAARERLPMLSSAVQMALLSESERVIDARTALPQLTNWLQDRWNVSFQFNTSVQDLESLKTQYDADRVVCATGAGLKQLLPELAHELELSVCSLQVSRLQLSPELIPKRAVATETSLTRYASFTNLPETFSLRESIQQQRPGLLEYGINPLASSCASGEMIVGDSHKYGSSPEIFSESYIDELYMSELSRVLNFAGSLVKERWMGCYAYSPVRSYIAESVGDNNWVFAVLNGLGMTLSFGLADDMVAGW
ncbi:TIGR03364 family FAD-dependent oxidoreductase [Parendozoicomonas haliclonae]|uniref:Bifunctional tRNA (Mnm(5)s(2)U34)-methyltransferase/FAD-dependent cmnm(5)s(2)U34 oxidoreductase n=1 Tax=Parendozoicomonas haliclonae TaxID=1960125 RepID=A0A1X7AQ90_9GAMM|nr:TIGR03364 family FAD-dependent oxidoreductase [Parendozoicomonas haliclonae]SMA50282.1 bifunctional tRNA (mnm(5)s(2)U34)-methyltransferase/FAD-dependent cmnm(5)s(2)U34 oxidoreductase [Parendozoicomonas haliclonae]